MLAWILGGNFLFVHLASHIVNRTQGCTRHTMMDVCSVHINTPRTAEAEITYWIRLCSVWMELVSPCSLCPDLFPLSPRCSSRRHRHRSPLANRHEGRRLSHWLLVQPRALLLDVQRDDVSGEGPVSTVEDLGWAHNGDIGGTRTLQNVGFSSTVAEWKWSSAHLNAWNLHIVAKLLPAYVCRVKVRLINANSLAPNVWMKYGN